ncbi:disease resistance protein At4g27190-like [Bidens hawaiensis]|uniref:disease resistance protein At4g27190-like n=1 Tax=Bidens hawaiensis TaxID=980011 RepID=UPI004049A639
MVMNECKCCGAKALELQVIFILISRTRKFTISYGQLLWLWSLINVKFLQLKMEFVTPFITPIIESLMVPVKKHLAFFFSSTKHVTKMNERLQDLNETKHEIEEKKKDALRNDHLIPNRVFGWLEQVETIKEEAEAIPTSGNGCLNLKMRYIAGKRSFNTMEKIDKLVEKRKEIEWADKQRPLGMVISPSSSSSSEITLNIFPSRKLLLNEVLKLLEADSETQMMGLWGMGGVGKTTMMEDIEKVVKRSGMFKWVVKVSIGTKYDPIATQDAIAKQLDVALTDENKETRAVRLGNSFAGMSKSGENILLIMDDVCEAIQLKDIGLTSPFPKNFKLLVTSRNEKVCTKMNIETSSKVFKIIGIEEKEANSFFWKTVGLSDPDGELCKIGENILNKCSGLPIAIKTIAEALKGEKKDAWKVAHNSLQRHNLNDIDDLKDVVYKIFEISYGYLKKDVDKAIFVLCGLFPVDFDIVLEELVRYGWGLHFFTEANSLDEARKQTSTSVSSLIRANLLTESSTIECVKMHDLARDFVLNNISEFKQASIVNHGDKCEWPTQEYCERILLTCQGMSEFPQDFYYPNLALLKIMNGNKLLTFPKDFYKLMEKLEVISYDRMWNPLLSVPVQCFSSLRTLCLRSCSLVDNDISFLGDLVNLEVLSVSHCGIRKLPSTIRKLKRLKLLDLTGCANLCIDDGIFQNLDKLEELYMRAFAYKPIWFTDASCEELKMLSENLNTLELEFFENILQPKDLSFKTLQRFRISMGCLLELFSKTEELHLSVEDMSYIDNISMSPSQSSTFSNLKVLHVFECPDLTYLFTSQMENGLKQLESLTVSSCPVLTSLVSLSNSVNTIELPQLVELKLYDLPNFTSIIHENEISTTQLLFNKEEFDNSTGEAVTHCKDMHFVRFFDAHEIAALSKEDLLKLCNSPLAIVEEVRRDVIDKIVEKFNKFVHYLVGNQLFNSKSGFVYETD